MSEPTMVKVFKNGTNMRRGGSTQGPDNVVGVVNAGEFPAYAQCTGEEVTEKDGDRTVKNVWWVLIKTPDVEGWVSAVRIAGGHDNEKIDGVPTTPTVFWVPPDLMP